MSPLRLLTKVHLDLQIFLDGEFVSVFELNGSSLCDDVLSAFTFSAKFYCYLFVMSHTQYEVNALKFAGARNTDAVVALFDVESPAPLQYWTVRDGFGGTLLFTPVPQTSAEAPSGNEGGDNKVTDLVPSKSKLTFISCLREFVVFDPYQREDEPEQPVVRDVSVPEEVSSAFTAMYGKAEQPKKKDAPPDVLSALGRAPWGTLLNGPSHVLPSLSVICIPFMDSLLKKRTEQT